MGRACLDRAELGEEHPGKEPGCNPEELIRGRVEPGGNPEADTEADLDKPVEDRHQGKLVVVKDRDRVEELHLVAFGKPIKTEVLHKQQCLPLVLEPWLV